MRVLQLNVRYSEGGAARVALELHKGLLDQGHKSTFAYGYAARGRPSAQAAHDSNAIQVSYQPVYALHRTTHSLIGIEFPLPSLMFRDEFEDALLGCDLLHLHATHSYFLPLENLARVISGRQIPIVWTAHDHWLVTGRCAFLDGCSGWKSGCGQCVSLDNYPSTLVDLSRHTLQKKLGILRSLKERLTIISPSKHLASDLLYQYPDFDIRVVPNSADADYIRECRTHQIQNRKASTKPKVLVMANDLAYEGKTNRDFIASLVATGTVEITTVGINSPFTQSGVINLGRVTGRRALLEIMRTQDCMLFTSAVDNFPLSIAEALCAGLPVVATQSAAAQEVLSLVGGICVSNLADFIHLLQENRLLELYPGSRTPEALQDKAILAFAPERFLADHLLIYKELLEKFRSSK